MKKAILIALAILGLTATAHAQTVSGGVYAGVTSNDDPSFMLMSDIGTKLDLEPWVQTFGRSAQVGADLIYLPKWIGVTVGAYSNPGTARAGVVLSFFGVQARVMKTTEGEWQGIAYFNINLTDRTYMQLWAAPAQGTSSYLVGIGHTFKR